MQLPPQQPPSIALAPSQITHLSFMVHFLTRLSEPTSMTTQPTLPLTAGPSKPRRTTKATHPNLPPGLILDEHGKVCKVCNSWRDFAKVSPGSSSKLPSTSSSGKGALSGLGAFGAMASAQPAQPARSARDRRECPPDVEALGRSTWTFLHTTAAYYPVHAPPDTQRNMLNLLKSLSIFYPCTYCAEDFRSDMGSHPPDVSGRAGLSRWLCERHNEVNVKLGKGSFECVIEKLDERWKDGPLDGSCD